MGGTFHQRCSLTQVVATSSLAIHPMKRKRDNMKSRYKMALIAAAVAAIAGCANFTGNPMTYFITSVNPGKGADLGGLAGADAHCEKLAAAVGAGGKDWRAYLSTQATDKAPAVNARDRIGNGAWVNAKGVVVAYNSAELHGANNLTKQTSLNEKGEVINGRGDTPNQHDVLTGSQPDGTAFPPGKDMTCSNWTNGGAGSAMVGHHDRDGTNPNPVANVSWNTSHGSRGCDMNSLKASGGAGLYYCFATK
jgi:hypothetical protein